jgi:Protein of unknown function (DUF3604)
MYYRFNGKQKSLAFDVWPDVTLADARAKRDAARRLVAKGKLTQVGNTVGLATASCTSSLDAPELRNVWRDPDFTKGQKAFYYARVLEIPTPRWTAYDVARFKVKSPAGAKLKGQEQPLRRPSGLGRN